MSDIKITEKEIKKIELYIHGITLRVGDFLKDYRKRRSLTIAELSKRASVSSTVITDLENSRSLPRTEVLLKLAFALDIPFNKLFEKFMDEGVFDTPYSSKPKQQKPTLESMIKSVGLGGLDAKEVLSFIEFKKFQNKNRK